MQQQSFTNHSRYVPVFHFITSGIIFISFIIAIVILVTAHFSLQGVYNCLASISLGFLFTFVRVFSTGNQDRIIRAEENLRSFRLTGKLPDERLTKAQLLALRFASDEEFISLADRAIKENLSATDIKRAVQQWRADNHRI